MGVEFWSWVCGSRNITEERESCGASASVIQTTHYMFYNSEDNTTNPEGKWKEPHQTIVSYLYICDEGKRMEPN